MCRSGWDPTRLVFVGTPSQPALRICLRSYINPNDRYITLSHCWGLAKFFTLTKSNYQQCPEQIQPEDLPQTFQDAIRIARDLDTKYIWIDSLCIIQDSLDDWARESLEMADVYSYSYCTIAAAAASETGVFKSLPEGIYQFVDPMLWEHEVTLSPLSKRAWVLQESVLSRRTLYFCSDQLFFGYSSAGFCEDYPQGFPETIRIYEEMQPLTMSCGWSKIDIRPSSPYTPSWTEHGTQAIPFVSGLSNVTSNQSSYLECWNILLQNYCKRAITNPQDKLIAISGLASRIHAANPTTSYFAGIWCDSKDFHDRKLLDQMLWQHAKPSSRLPTYIAPTWSWASVQGEISINDFWLPESQQHLASLLDISVDKVGENPFAQISSGFISLKGPLLPSKLTVDKEFVRSNSAYIRLAERLGDLIFKGNSDYESKKDQAMATSRYIRLQNRLFPSKVGGGVNKDREFFSVTLDMEFSEKRQFHPDSDSMVTNMAVFCMPICRDHIINDEEIPSCVIRGLVVVAVPPEEHSMRSVLENKNGLHNKAGGRIFKRVGTFYEYSEFFPLWNGLYGQSEEIVTII